MEKFDFNVPEQAPSEPSPESGSAKVIDSQSFEEVPGSVVTRENVLEETQEGIDNMIQEEEAKKKAPGIFAAMTNILKDHLKKPESEEDLDEIPPKA